MAHKARLNQTKKINQKKEPNYFEEITEVFTKVKAYKRQLYEVEQFQGQWIRIYLVTLPKFTSNFYFYFWALSKWKSLFDVKS